MTEQQKAQVHEFFRIYKRVINDPFIKQDVLHIIELFANKEQAAKELDDYETSLEIPF